MQSLSIPDGLKALSLKQYKPVHEACIKAIKVNVKDAVPYFLLGVLAEHHGNFDKAIELFKVAESHNRNEAYFATYLAKVFSTLRNQTKAKQAADRAAKLVVDDAYLLDTLAVVYSRAGYHETAIPLFKRAIKLQQGQANMHYNLGASAQFIGDFKLAKSAYERALKLDPNFYRAWASLVYLEKQTAENNYIEKLIRLFEQSDNNSDANLQLGHAIAKSHEDMGEYKTSLEWLKKAKQEKCKELPYDRASGVETFVAAKATVNVNQSTPNVANTSQIMPIFVVGLPRTGTTLVDRILSTHSDVTSVGELNIFAELIKGESGSLSNLILDAETLANYESIDLQRVGQSYISHTRELARGNQVTVDKMPLNFFYAGLIHRALPNARIIALRRNAMDSCLSNFRQLFSTQYSFYNYTFNLQDTAWFYQQFDTLMSHWRNALPQDRFTEVHYENIVHDQETQTRRLLEFCDLEWQEACLNFHQNTAPVSTASSVQVRQPLYSGSIDRWKKYGEQLSELETALRS